MSAKQPDQEKAIVDLMLSHQAALRAFVLSMMPGESDVEDVIQEANSLVWEKRNGFEIGTSFKAWMFSVARFKVLSFWRDRERRKEWVVPEETLIMLGDEAEEVGFDSVDQRQEALRQCLGQLRPIDRGLVLRRYFKGGRLRDLAAEAGRSVESVSVSLHRIRSVLRECVRRRMQAMGRVT